MDRVGDERCSRSGAAAPWTDPRRAYTAIGEPLFVSPVWTSYREWSFSINVPWWLRRGDVSRRSVVVNVLTERLDGAHGGESSPWCAIAYSSSKGEGHRLARKQISC
jgi:hypothetical protein